MFITMVAYYLFNQKLRGGGKRHSQIELAVSSLSDDTQVLLLGASHFYTGVDPSQLSVDAMNLSTGSWNYEAQLATLKSNLSKMPNLKLCVLELDHVPYTLNTLDNRVNRFEGDLSSYFELDIDFYDIPGLRKSSGFLIWLKTQFPVRNFLEGKKFNAVRKKSKDMFECEPERFLVKAGYRSSYGDLEMYECRKQRQKKRADSKYDQLEENRNALIEMLHILQENQIEILFLRFPRVVGDTKYLDDLKDLVGGELGEVKVFDFESNPSFGEEHFSDPNHLNVKGSVIFTGMVNDIIVKELNN